MAYAVTLSAASILVIHIIEEISYWILNLLPASLPQMSHNPKPLFDI